MTTLVRVQHIIHGKSELPTDQYVNTFHFVRTGVSGAGTPLTVTEANALVGVVDAFYMGTTNPTRASMFFYMAQTVFAPNARHTKVYAMDGPPPHYPIVDTRPTGQPANSTTNLALAHEIAVCLSYEGVPLAGAKQARRRGRLYLGPLNSVVIGPDSLGNMRPVSGFLGNLRDAGQAMKTLAAAAGWTWVVHSPTNAKLNADGNMSFTGDVPVYKVWTDDAFDTQRRRGIAPTAKTTLVLA